MNFNTFVTGVKNLWHYRSLIWNDRDWDHYFLLKMMQFKLERMRDFWVDGTHYIDSEKELETLTKLCEDINMLVKDDFGNTEYDDLEAKWGPMVMKDNHEGTYTLMRELETPENEEQIRQDTLAAFASEEKDKNEVKERFFNTLRDNYERFWD